jgi:hypothetical protein
MPRSSLRTVDELTIALDRDDQSAAETWRLVSEAAVRLGYPRPSYPNVRRLVRAERTRQQLRRELRETVREAARTVAAGRAPNFDYTMRRIQDAAASLAAEGACVSETRGSRSGRGDG